MRAPYTWGFTVNFPTTCLLQGTFLLISDKVISTFIGNLGDNNGQSLAASYNLLSHHYTKVEIGFKNCNGQYIWYFLVTQGTGPVLYNSWLQMVSRLDVLETAPKKWDWPIKNQDVNSL